MNRLIARLATLHHTRAFIIGALDSPSERGHFFGMLAELGIPSIVGVLLFTNVIMGPLQDAPVAGPVFDHALPDGGINLSLPLSPVNLQLADVACNAEGVEKAQVNAGTPPIYTYTAKHTTKAGASVFIRWTDGPGVIGQNAFAEVNGVSAYPEPDDKTKACLRDRAKPAPSTGGPR